MISLLKALPKNATALDFAFSIHTQVGMNCRGAKINGKLKPISHELKSGDQVEIITAKNQKPNVGWLEFVVTARARTRIKNALKEDQKKIAEEGKEILFKLVDKGISPVEEEEKEEINLL